MSKQRPPAPTASAVGPCPTIIQIVGRPGNGSLPSTIAPPDHPCHLKSLTMSVTATYMNVGSEICFCKLESMMKKTFHTKFVQNLSGRSRWDIRANLCNGAFFPLSRSELLFHKNGFEKKGRRILHSCFNEFGEN